MSEKLYRVTEAVDTFDGKSPIPERYLVFEGPGGPYKEFFPENRTTLFFKGELYDWYGRKVQLPDNIYSIISPYGYEDSGPYYAQEIFLVKLKNQRLALANLTHHTDQLQSPFQETAIYSQSKYKHKLLHSVLATSPRLKLKDWSFQRITDFNQDCFYGSKLHDCVAFIGVTGKTTLTKNRPSFEDHYIGYHYDTVVPSIWFTYGPTYDCLIEHNIAESKKAILRYSLPFSYPERPKRIITNYLVGNLTFSKNNTKITAYAPIPDKNGNNRISTDIEILNHCSSCDKIVWYYDPLP